MIVLFNLYASNIIISHYLQKLGFKNISIPAISMTLYIFASIFASEAYVKITSNIAIVSSCIIPIILFMIVKVKNYEKKTL